MKIAIIALMQLFLALGFCQTNTYSSKLIGADDFPVSYATIHELGTQNYTTSDENGIFKLNTDNRSFTLHISSIGYVSQDIEVINGHIPEFITIQIATEQLD